MYSLLMHSPKFIFLRFNAIDQICSIIAVFSLLVSTFNTHNPFSHDEFFFQWIEAIEDFIFFFFFMKAVKENTQNALVTLSIALTRGRSLRSESVHLINYCAAVSIFSKRRFRILLW